MTACEMRRCACIRIPGPDTRQAAPRGHQEQCRESAKCNKYTLLNAKTWNKGKPKVACSVNNQSPCTLHVSLSLWLSFLNFFAHSFFHSPSTIYERFTVIPHAALLCSPLSLHAFVFFSQHHAPSEYRADQQLVRYTYGTRVFSASSQPLRQSSALRIGNVISLRESSTFSFQSSLVRLLRCR